MTELERALLEKLIELQRLAASMPSANPKPDLGPVFASIDQLTAGLPRDTDPRLLHFLQRKSYQKARQWLEGEEVE